MVCACNFLVLCKHLSNLWDAKFELICNNLIFFMFIRFLAILFVKTMDSYLMNFVHGVFYIAIFSNMVLYQRARYRIVRFVIVNKSQQQRLNQRRRTHENVTDRREMETV